MYSMDPDFLFVAQQMVETHSLESKIDMAMSHGSLETSGNKTKLTPSKDAFSIFQSLPGTPAYWKQFRSEIFSRIEQLGPFHLFFTLSCAEMRYIYLKMFLSYLNCEYKNTSFKRWPSVLAEVLKVVEEGRLKVRYELDTDGNWDGREETIFIEEYENGEMKSSRNLTEYMDYYLYKKKISKTDFFKDHFVLITRIFDKRVKDFLSLVLMKKGIEHYCYRVEFQMRGYVYKIKHIYFRIVHVCSFQFTSYSWCRMVKTKRG